MKKIHILFLAAVAIVLSSCFATRTTVGDFNKLTNEGDTNVAVYNKAKQCYVLNNLVPLGQKHVPTPPSGNCQINTKFNALDMLVSMCTANLFSMKTIKVYAVASEGYEPQEPKPVIDNGLQYEIEGTPAVPGGRLALSYKFAKRFSLGVGYCVYSESDNYLNRDRGAVDHAGSIDLSKAFFFTGQIRPWNKCFSPILGAELGWRTYDPFIDVYDYKKFYKDSYKKMYVLPYAGTSWRLGSNCYVSIKVGFNMVMGKIKPTEEIINAECDTDIPLSTLYYGINFTHTLPIGAGLHTKAAEKVRNVMNR